MSWVKLWWHCLINTMQLKPCQMVKEIYYSLAFPKGRVRRYCTCGYMNEDGPEVKS